MQDIIFRKYDIRGIVSKDLLIEDVYDFGKSLAFYFKQRNHDLHCIVVSMDGRSHSQAIKNELTRAFFDSGLDVLFCGICPTPVFYFAMHKQYEQGIICPGVMITASHNGKEYNGFKIAYGKHLISAEEILKIRDVYKQRLSSLSEAKGQEKGISIIPDYISWLENAFSHLKKSTISMIIDCGNGASAAVIPELVLRMQWKNVRVLYGTIEGDFPHRSPDPSQKGALAEMARELACMHNERVCGAAFDGDADRVVAMTHDGTVLTGDSLLGIFAESIAQSKQPFSVVFDSKCSQVLSSSLDAWGVQYERTATGHAYVKAKMIEIGALLGGELSNHFMFCDRYFGYDDGMYAMMRLLEILNDTEMSLSALYGRFPKSYTTGEVRIPCQETRKLEIVHKVHETFLVRPGVCISTLDGVRVDTEYGWGIVRASNTEPVISFSCESMTQDGFERIKKDFMNILDTVI